MAEYKRQAVRFFPDSEFGSATFIIFEYIYRNSRYLLAAKKDGKNPVECKIQKNHDDLLF